MSMSSTVTQEVLKALIAEAEGELKDARAEYQAQTEELQKTLPNRRSEQSWAAQMRLDAIAGEIQAEEDLVKRSAQTQQDKDRNVSPLVKEQNEIIAREEALSKEYERKTRDLEHTINYVTSGKIRSLTSKIRRHQNRLAELEEAAKPASAPEAPIPEAPAV